MQLDRGEIRKEKVARVLRYFGVIMAIFYLTLGWAIIYFPGIAGLTPAIRYAAGTLLVLYGVFRFYRVLKQG